MNNGIRAAETCNEHFDIQNSLFDILRFVESAKEKGSCLCGMSLFWSQALLVLTLRRYFLLNRDGNLVEDGKNQEACSPDTYGNRHLR